uniref:Coiled-coil domain-containing protein 177 n=1 Tax=Petromyzon marinus TaxID=7757 RepID=A0AAJ7X3C4_PETMA|nr:coiled-coil domain-containing protein 177 [Petromyzon marinus]
MVDVLSPSTTRKPSSVSSHFPGVSNGPGDAYCRPAAARPQEKAEDAVEDNEEEAAPRGPGGPRFSGPRSGSMESGSMESGSSPLLHIDLYNFDSPRAEGSRYVLTSPRSLESCARCGIRPVELLSRPLADFAAPGTGDRESNSTTNLGGLGRDSEEARAAHAAFERERRRKLRRCRDERERILLEEREKRREAQQHNHQQKRGGSVDPLPSKLAGTGLRPLGIPHQSRSLETVRASLPLPGHRTPVALSDGCSLDDSSGSHDTVSDPLGKTRPRQRPQLLGAASRPPLPRRAHDDLPCPGGRTSGPRCTFTGKSLSLGDLSQDPGTAAQLQQLTRAAGAAGAGAGTGPRKRARAAERGLELPSRDLKIAALMLARHREETLTAEQRRDAHLRWADARRAEEERRALDERERGRALAQRLREREPPPLEPPPPPRGGAAADAAAAAAGGQDQGRQQQNLHERLSLAERKRLEAKERRRGERRLSNERERERHLRTQRELAREEDAGEARLREALDARLRASQRRRDEEETRRLRELQLRAERDGQRLRRARAAAERLDEDMRSRREALAAEAERRLRQAALAAGEGAQRRAERAARERAEKERAHGEAARRAVLEEENRRRERLARLREKEERGERAARRRDARLEESRSVARASFEVREKVREATQTRSFDKMVREAELQLRLL